MRSQYTSMHCYNFVFHLSTYVPSLFMQPKQCFFVIMRLMRTVVHMHGVILTINTNYYRNTSCYRDT